MFRNDACSPANDANSFVPSRSRPLGFRSSIPANPAMHANTARVSDQLRAMLLSLNADLSITVSNGSLPVSLRLFHLSLWSRLNAGTDVHAELPQMGKSGQVIRSKLSTPAAFIVPRSCVPELLPRSACRIGTRRRAGRPARFYGQNYFATLRWPRHEGEKTPSRYRCTSNRSPRPISGRSEGNVNQTSATDCGARLRPKAS
jgi:hypothetical protein